MYRLAKYIFIGHQLLHALIKYIIFELKSNDSRKLQVNGTVFNYYITIQDELI